MSSGESTIDVQQSENAFIKDEIFDLIKDSEEKAVNYINDGKLKIVDCTDENGTTALQYAAFRGLKKLCNLLINKGANVNANTHDQGYTALMFAAISNHTDVVRLLLNNDADIDKKNSIGRTATQMASFVNSTDSVDIINNYISKSDIEYYTRIHSANETKPKLPAVCVNDLHEILTSTNYAVIFTLKKIMLKAKVLMPHLNDIIKTLNAFITKSFKKDDMSCPNDVLSFKLHYCNFIFEYVKKSYEKANKTQFESDLDEENFYKKFFETIAKQFIIEEICPELNKPFRSFEEKFLRELIKQFPYIECALLRQMVTIISKVKLGFEPTSLYVITSCLNGQRMKPDEDDENTVKMHTCVTCTKKGAMLCSRCKQTAYCDQFCQRVHWSIHKKQCNTATQ